MSDKLLNTLLFLFLSFTSVSAQEVSFAFTQQDNFIQLINDSSTITMEPYKKEKDRSSTRIVTINGVKYSFSINKTLIGKMTTIRDAQGVKLASVFLNDESKYNVVLANGAVLKWQSNGNTWGYTFEGREVIHGTYMKTEGKKQITIKNITPAVATEVIQLISLERGAEIASRSANTGVWIGVAVALGIISAMQNN